MLIYHYEVEGKLLNLDNAPAVLSVDTIFTWYSETAKGNCQCHLRIYKIAFDKAIIIASELPDNPGRSITDEALTLIHLVCYKFGLAPTKTMWVEHYPKGYFKDEATYDEVMLIQGRVISQRIKQRKIEDILGMEL